MTIGRIIEGRSPAILTCEAHCTIGEAVTILAERRIGALPVMENGAVVGMFSERDVIYKLQGLGSQALVMSVRDAMTAPAVTVSPETEALEALSLMTRRRIRHLPVMQGNRMVGFVSIGDLVKYRIEKIQSEAEAMRTYIQTA
ncbi:MAG: CBS domain-containing protein [Sphingomonadaceae bacterium]|nr:CBS domain-containing protein [Sphingomonadaceae bacterium]